MDTVNILKSIHKSEIEVIDKTQNNLKLIHKSEIEVIVKITYIIWN